MTTLNCFLINANITSEVTSMTLINDNGENIGEIHVELGFIRCLEINKLDEEGNQTNVSTL